METIKVNMNPNPLDVQTIHASQNDTEAREWGFELHNNGELIDTSEVKEQLVFKAYKGGTEQLLPENGSTPTTSPFLGDIRYPQGLLTDQEFTYRQSPTEKDGLAKIQTIYGNTLKWNQLINDTGSTTTTNGITFTKNADGSITLNGTATAQADYSFERIDYVNGHKYLINGIPSGATVDGYRALLFSANVTSNRIITATIDDWFTPRIRVSEGVTVSNVVFRLNIFDLTKMFGQGNEPSTVEEFTSLFSLSYYSYNQGSLLSFSGNGIKTVGKNQVANIVRGYFNAGNTTIRVDNDSESVVFYAISGCTYTVSSSIALNRNNIARCDSPNLENYAPIYDAVNIGANDPRVWVATWTGWTVWYIYSARSEAVENSAQVEFGTTATAYEPYTSSLLNLPISTYFPSGMKDVPDYTNGGKIYDEMTSNKADTRVGSVDLGTLDWTTYSSPERHIFRAYILSNMKQPNREILPNAMCSRYEPMAYSPISVNDDGYFAIGDYRIVIIEHDYTDPAAFKESLSNVYLYYELATPTEAPFTTASLVTENAEIPLSNEDGILIGKCTEQLSENPGFIDAKIKLSDADGECYSNKIQLHIERSPQ